MGLATWMSTAAGASSRMPPPTRPQRKEVRNTLDNESTFARIIEDHLELKRKNSELDGRMPLERYRVEDPFNNHPLFKTEEQARIEDTLSGEEPAARPSPLSSGRADPSYRRVRASVCRRECRDTSSGSATSSRGRGRRS